MRLLRAELLKLHRPLTWAVALMAVVFCVLLAVGAANNARNDTVSTDTTPSCAALRLAPGPTCRAGQAIYTARATEDRAATDAAAARTAARLHPLAAGAEAADLLASMPGLLVFALLVGGQVGGEWSGRTMKQLLAQHGRRWQVLAAKFAALWIAGAGLVATCWAALAVAGPVVVRAFGLHADVAGPSPFPQVGRSLLVLAVFVGLGLAVAMAARSALGATAGTAGAGLLLLALAELPGIGRWTPATWIEAWMGFQGPAAGYLPDGFWSRYTPLPGRDLGLAGLLATLAVCAAVAVRAFQRADVAG